ncbi:MAG: hypothetical protein K0Q49_493 [Haloplasmataceae bacterium]|nr:hypothetical protein [Haloplasmataceae bacterium]
MLRNKKFLIVSILLLLVSISVTVVAKYIPSNKDTKLPPDEVTNVIFDPTEFQKLYENDNFIFYYRDSRDVFAITDRRTGYTWKTGIDRAFSTDTLDACDELSRKATDAEKLATCIPIEHEMVHEYLAIANSLISIEYYDATRAIKNSSSAALKDVTSTLVKVNNDETHYRLDVNFEKIKIGIKVHIYLNEKGISYEIRDEEVIGEGSNNLHAILITPFLGASGGVELIYNLEIDDYDYDNPVYKDLIPGYVLVPDGSGALIRFEDYNTSDSKPLSNYQGSVYGTDYSQVDKNINYQFRYVEFKEPTMPLFGIAHGNNQAAFIAYATSGAEHMNIISTPDEGRFMKYNFAYPKFKYNVEYYQIYNRAGSGYNTLLEERNHFDIDLSYEFLAGDGSTGLPANYVGMAKAYRNYLIEQELLKVVNYAYSNVPTRLDFLMSDVKKNLVGFENVIMTTIDDVENNLRELQSLGVKNINSGLYGYQKGGITLGKPNNISYSGEIATKSEMKEAIKNLSALGIDISLSQDFVKINEEQMKVTGNSIRHASSKYAQLNMFDAEAPVTSFYYARVEKSIDWLNDHLRDLKSLNANSVTIEGLTNTLLTDYTGKITSRAESIELIKDGLSDVSEKYAINASNPNMYTWEYVDRYLNAPVFNSQYIIQTDTVPFLQLVLNGTMELYAPYSNFSFYTQSDVLRMIDYNVYPSFVLTQQPSYLMMSTNSNHFYSTEYSQYKDLIIDIYTEVDHALKNVINHEWTNREVLANGVILNTYDNDIKIIINYTNDPYSYNGIQVEPLDFEIIGKE